MKIYIGHSKELNFKEELYLSIRESQLNSEHEITLPHEMHQEGSDFVTKDIIKTCDVIVAEVSFPSTGLGIELGWADTFDRSIICMYRKGTKVSESLQVICKNFIEYTDKEEMVEKLGNILARRQ